MQETTDEAGKLRQRVKALHRPDKRGRYPRELKAELLSYARGRWEAGVPTRQIGEELGLRSSTLVGWRKALRRGASDSACPRDVASRMRRAIVVQDSRWPAAPSVGLTLHLRGGHRVEGLSTAELSQVLKELW